MSIVFGTIFASGYKVAARSGSNSSTVNRWLFVGSAATVVAYILFKWRLDLNARAMLLGLAGGAMAYVAIISFFHHMKMGKLSVSWTVVTLSVGFPVLASIFIWGENPSPRQITGLVLLALALIIFGWKNGGEKIDV